MTATIERTMKSGHLIIAIIILGFLLGGLPSCKSKRAIIKAPIKEKGPEYLFSKMNEKEFRFNAIEAKFNIEYSQGRKNYDFKGQLRLVKDSLIWLNFNQDLGIEIARVMITQDSVKFIDRFRKQYLITDYGFINDFLNTNIDFGILQSIILGNDFEYYEDAKFKASIDGGQYKLSTSERRKLKKYVRNTDDETRIFLQQTWLNPDNFKITQIKLKELTKSSKKLTAEYSDFEPIDIQLFPHTIKYLVEAEDAIDVVVKYNRVTLKDNMQFPFNIPSKYSSVK
jgi:hypothetical protein